MTDYDCIWFWKSKLGERRGQKCRVIARGRMNSVMVEFEDGYRVITGRYAVRKLELVEPVSKDLKKLAGKAVKAMKARESENLELWAKNLSEDLSGAGESEYGK